MGNKYLDIEEKMFDWKIVKLLEDISYLTGKISTLSSAKYYRYLNPDEEHYFRFWEYEFQENQDKFVKEVNVYLEQQPVFLTAIPAFFNDLVPLLPQQSWHSWTYTLMFLLEKFKFPVLKFPYLRTNLSEMLEESLPADWSKTMHMNKQQEFDFTLAFLRTIKQTLQDSINYDPSDDADDAYYC